MVCRNVATLDERVTQIEIFGMAPEGNESLTEKPFPAKILGESVSTLGDLQGARDSGGKSCLVHAEVGPRGIGPYGRGGTRRRTFLAFRITI